MSETVSFVSGRGYEVGDDESKSCAEAAAKAVFLAVSALARKDFHKEKRRSTIEVCDENKVAVYIVEVTKVRQES